MITVKEIIVEYLKKNGFDGLAGEECGCGLGDDFICCDGEGKVLDCEPAYKKVCNRDGCPNASNYCDGETGDNCFTTKKQPENGLIKLEGK